MPDIVWDERRERSEAFSETDETYVPFPGCETGLNRMIFSLNGEGSCDCPAHASCELDTGCHCDFGYEISSDGSCQEKNCPSVKEITEITEEYCCEKVSGVWDGIVGCVCPEESYFNGTSCVASQGFCVYSYEGPSGGGYYSNCSYTYAEPSGGGCLLTLSRVGRAPCTDSLQLGLTPRSGYMVLRYLYENCVQPEIWRDVIEERYPLSRQATPGQGRKDVVPLEG